MKNKLNAILELLGVLIAMFLAGLLSASLWERYRLQDIEKAQADTLVVRDTVYYSTPQASDSIVVRYETVRVPIYERVKSDTVRVSDTVTCYVPRTDSVTFRLPIMQRIYRDSLYTAWVSGYEPRLDSIALYTRTQYCFKARDKPAKRWGVGLGVGVGITPAHGIQPYIGIGLHYNLFSF